MNKFSSRRSDSFHSVGSNPALSPSPPPPLPTAPAPLLLLPPPPSSAFPLSPGKTAPVDGDGVVKEAAFRRILKRSEGKERLRMASDGFRVSQAVLCLVSLSVMAADRTRGWSGDSFFRYREYRFFLSVDVIGFLYAGFQLCDMAYHVIAGKHIIAERLRRQFEFLMDQIMAYLLLSAASAAATRVDDWELNWGKDQFTKMVSASVGIAFVAFLSFALSSLVSGYNLCSRDFA